MTKQEAYNKLLEAIGEINLLRYVFRKEFEKTILLCDYEQLLYITQKYEEKIKSDGCKLNLKEYILDEK